MNESPQLEPAKDRPFDGNPSWRVVRELPSGNVMTIRPIVPSDRDELARAFEEASYQSRYLRFLGSVGRLSDDMLTYLTCVDQRTHVAIVATITTPDLKTERGVGVGRFIFLNEPGGIVEAAISVVDDMQHKGVGKALLHELEQAVRVRNVRCVRAHVLTSNKPMRAILEAAGAKRVVPQRAAQLLGDEEVDRATIVYEIELEPTPRSATLMDVLRGAAQTMTLTLQRWLPPSSSIASPTSTSDGESDRRNGHNDDARSRLLGGRR
ncbi:MAG: GNAT family N-acetyltransferase [Polyangiaceae bacterium]|nr:GNAT family N-acetyltransferase [Polyangiaceae bacterium]